MMPRSAKPKRAHRPRAIGRPMLERMRRELILPAHLALNALAYSDDARALTSARHTLATLLNYMLAALTADRRPVELVVAGMDALVSVIERHRRTNTYRASGPELQALRAAVAHCDEQLPYLRTDQLTSALLKVDRVMASIESRAQQPTGAPA